MKLLFDFFPLLAFFIAFRIYDIFVATGVLIAASILQIAYFWFKHRRFEIMHLVTLVLVVIFGTATILLQDSLYLIWKATIVNWLFAIGCLLSQFIGKKNLIERLMSANITLPAQIWTKLNLSWVIFFIVLGVLNLYVAFNFSEATWVNFKVFGILSLTLLFVIAQSIYLSRYLKTPQPSTEETKS